MKLYRLHTEVVKRGDRYLVIVRKELRLFGKTLWLGAWKQLPKRWHSRVSAMKVANKIEFGNKIKNNDETC